MSANQDQAASILKSIESEVPTEASPFLHFLVKHARKIAFGIVGCILAIGAYWFYSYSQEQQKQEDIQTLGQIAATADVKSRIQKLDEYLQKSSSTAKVSALFYIIEGAKELKDYDKQITAWESIAGLDQTLKITATAGIANVLIEQNKLKEALTRLDAVSSQLSGLESYQVNSQISLLAELLGDYNRAISACDAVLSQALPESEKKIWTLKKDALTEMQRTDSTAAKN